MINLRQPVKGQFNRQTLWLPKNTLTRHTRFFMFDRYLLKHSLNDRECFSSRNVPHNDFVISADRGQFCPIWTKSNVNNPQKR